MLKVGDKAPDFRLPDGAGNTVSLKDFAGKKVVLYFYPRDMTPGCTREACSFSENIASLRAKGAVVLGVSADTPASHKKFAEAYGLAFPLLSDESRETIKAYGAWKKKSFMGKTFMGIVRSTFIIDERGRIAHVFPKVSVAGHTEEVLGRL